MISPDTGKSDLGTGKSDQDTGNLDQGTGNLEKGISRFKRLGDDEDNLSPYLGIDLTNYTGYKRPDILGSNAMNKSSK